MALSSNESLSERSFSFSSIWSSISDSSKGSSTTKSSSTWGFFSNSFSDSFSPNSISSFLKSIVLSWSSDSVSISSSTSAKDWTVSSDSWVVSSNSWSISSWMVFLKRHHRYSLDQYHYHFHFLKDHHYLLTFLTMLFVPIHCLKYHQMDPYLYHHDF